jgi:hypothetical protein
MKKHRQHRDEFWVGLAAILLLILLATSSCSASQVQANTHGILTPTIAGGTAGLLTANPLIGVAVAATTAGAEIALPTGKRAAVEEAVEAITKVEAAAMSQGFVDGLASEIYSLLKLAAALVAAFFVGSWLWTAKRKKVGESVRRELSELRERWEESNSS